MASFFDIFGGGGSGDVAADMGVDGVTGADYKDASNSGSDWTALGEYMATPGFQQGHARNQAKGDRLAQPVSAIPGYQTMQMQPHRNQMGLLNTNAGMDQSGNGLNGLLALMKQAQR